ncbi:glutathione S-transferase family protein [Rubrivivax rivuli]|uniref:Glutathione S-transferase family protein n=1 Tax=Rubrivivax rivuli TaxID=1862385 RepID=A0A437RRK0_9BURK|nr:glutathione S-transferase family protein [Rubrivivax rivuli]RVU49252.1 glutathione S-transferase family protein [Rubrivivax rivuli]
MPATLYLTRGSGNSFKPALVLRQTGRSATLKFLDVLAGESRRPEFLAINPLGQVPYLVLEDGRGIGQSNAIAWWAAEGTPLMPADAVSRAQALQWMIFEQTALEPNISPARFFTHIVPAQREAHAADIPRWLEAGHRGLGVLEQHLTHRAFITDHGYSVADVAVYGYTHLAGEGGFDLERYPAVQAWMQRVRSTPGYTDIGELLAH